MRTALVTGVSRRKGIGFAIARRLLTEGAQVFAQSWSPYDATEPWGADAGGIDAVIGELGAAGGTIDHAEVDLEDPLAAARLVDAAVSRFGSVDALVVNHARSSVATLVETTAEELDRTWAVNVRATLLLVQAFARQYVESPHGGRVVLFTSGQHRAPMSGEIPYATTKGALHQLTLTLSDALVDDGITVNCVNPGPTDTGWAGVDLAREVGRQLPRGRWNTPDEAAGVVAMLLGRDAGTITGQVVDAEAGFRRWQL
ncbi:3-oxoacyl-[acyl-carrier protein] reductase [Amycolatopsis marina]|uniref:3-oxoacyl-[acyl-carrier protein] reductase n=1 Tax=Amycolatopsis marina TaxID=490629 RepID=A0A1I0Y4H1_9PSEU|nr:SDR family oxidoreductase [Amycolatopsis marina]SFB08054.1 3-oxoacyl-[acyl-carrier protein] reductase [Amycolatopsis marina]